MKKDQVLYWAQRAVSAGLVVSYLLAIYAVFRTSLVPGKYLLLVIVIPGIVVALLAYGLLKKKFSRGKTIALFVVSAAVILANMYVCLVGSATSSFIGSLHDDDYTYEQYSIIAKKDQHIKLGTAATLHTGLISTDTNSAAVKTEVDKRTKTDYTAYDDLTSTTVALGNKNVNVATLKSSYVELLKENTPPFYQSVETLATFTIKVKKTSSTTKTDITKPFVMYISGIDTYGNLETVSRSDVNILVVVNPQTHKILLVNTPRDYYVQLHGTSGVRDKLTHAGIYGIDMSVNTMQDLYGVKIDYYMRVNFGSLTKIVDTLGGVNVFSDNTFSTDHYSFVTGYNQMDGKQALEFSRERHAFEDGDRTRGKDQQRVIDAIIQKLNRPETLVNYPAVMKSLEGTFQTNAPAADITAIIQQQMNSMGAWEVASTSVDGTGKTAPTYSMGSTPLYVMEPDPASLGSAKQKIQQYR